eukprot:TRINITY_DN67954_c0_g1_i1.p1 TRINITY_DN67954_c0_g1~~TRINITY_DN67954_c0_g1_i1.p1  ORF type:complete len:691 (+),score=126.12 TRINITY_DN67954_c0_g1_i1:80-2152(+)
MACGHPRLHRALRSRKWQDQPPCLVGFHAFARARVQLLRADEDAPAAVPLSSTTRVQLSPCASTRACRRTTLPQLQAPLQNGYTVAACAPCAEVSLVPAPHLQTHVQQVHRLWWPIAQFGLSHIRVRGGVQRRDASSAAGVDGGRGRTFGGGRVRGRDSNDKGGDVEDAFSPPWGAASEILFEEITDEHTGGLPKDHGGGDASDIFGPTGAFPGRFPFPGMEEVMDEEEEGQRRGGKRRGSQRTHSKPTVEKTPPPISDAVLRRTDARSLRRDQLIWAVGRASSIGLSEERLWRSFGEAIEDVGENQLKPSEMCRIMQAFGYAPAEAPLDGQQLQRLLRAFARQVREYSDEQLMRFIYGYGKLAAKRQVASQKFLDFVSTEVVERGKTLRGWRKTRILQALWTLPGTDNDFRKVLVGQVMQHISNLDSGRFAVFVPMLVELGFHERPGVVQKINVIYHKKMRGWQSSSLIVHTGCPLVLHDLMKMSTLVSWLKRLHEIAAPPLTPKPNTAVAAAVNEVGGRRKRCEWTEELEAMKIVELCLRHERPNVLANLPPKALSFLEAVRQAPFEPPEEHELFELPFVFAELRRRFRSIEVLLHPTLEGPYLLELADPLGRVVVEWDTNWELYPPWRRTQQEWFVQRKHRHLTAEGWRVVCVPLADYQALGSSDEKRDFLRRFVEENDLAYLRQSG